MSFLQLVFLILAIFLGGKNGFRNTWIIVGLTSSVFVIYQYFMLWLDEVN